MSKITPELPATVQYEMQPYGVVTLAGLRLVPNDRVADAQDLIGDVIAGDERSYLLGHVATRKATGTRRVYGIRPGEIERGTHGDGIIVRVAM